MHWPFLWVRFQVEHFTRLQWKEWHSSQFFCCTSQSVLPVFWASCYYRWIWICPCLILYSDRLLYLRPQGGSVRSSGCCWGRDRSQYHLEMVQREVMTESTFKKVTALTVNKDGLHKCSKSKTLISQTATGLAEPNKVFAPCLSFVCIFLKVYYRESCHSAQCNLKLSIFWFYWFNLCLML